jgi:predicted alpha/beta superfamily hydrolase
MMQEFMLSAQSPCIPTTTIGTLQYIAEFPTKQIQPRAVSVWLPPGYSPRQQYPVLYMHDGQNLFDPECSYSKVAWEADSIIADLVQKKMIRACIVVGIHNTNRRFIEYMPQKPFYATTQQEQKELLAHRNFTGKTIESDAYLAWIIRELKPYIDSTYSTSPVRRNTLIAGSSMGGLISLYALCKYPQVFGGAACLSTHWSASVHDSTPAFPRAIHRYLQKKLPATRTGHRLYFDYGTATLDRFYPKYQAITDSIMRRRGYTAKQWVTKEFPGAEHHERAWKTRFAEPLLFLLGRE